MRWIRKFHQIGGGGACLVVFLAADSFNFRFTQWRTILDPIKNLSLAATAALIVVLIDHFVTIRKVAAEVSSEIEARLVNVMEMFIGGSKDAGLVRFQKRLDFSNHY